MTEGRPIPRGSLDKQLSPEIPIPVSRISIVIPAYNEGGRIARVLTSLRQQQGTLLNQDCHVDIIVSDNGSIDNTKEITEANGAEVVGGSISTSVGSARQRGLERAVEQRGEEAADGQVIVFLDADTIPSEGYLQRIVDRFARNPGLMVSYGPVDYQFSDGKRIRRPRWVRRLELKSLFAAAGANYKEYVPKPYDYFPGCNTAIRASVLSQISGFHETDRAAEDIRFSLELKRLGLPASAISYDPKQVVKTSARKYESARGHLSLGKALRDFLGGHPPIASDKPGLLDPVGVIRDFMQQHGKLQ